MINLPIMRSLGLYVNLIASEQSESEGRSNCIKTSLGEVIYRSLYGGVLEIHSIINYESIINMINHERK